MINTEEIHGFPSDFLSPDVKDQQDYCLKCCKATVQLSRLGLGTFVGQNQDNVTRRAYARGNQPSSKYKPILGVKDRREKHNPNPVSYKALSWDNLRVLPKFIHLLIGRLINQDNDIGVRALDKYAQDARRKRKIELQEWLLNQRFLGNVSKKVGIQYQSPVQEDLVPPPENMGEINTYMEMFYKEDFCLVAQDLMRNLNGQDNYQQTLMDVARDMIEVSMAATKTYRVGRNIRRRRCDNERMIMSSTSKATADDIKWIGEYWDLTIGQLKEICGDQFTEKQYKEIAEKHTGEKFSVNADKYYETNLCYPWDNTKVTVLDLTWWSPNWRTYQIKPHDLGGFQVYEKPYQWWSDLSAQGVTEKSFNERNTNQIVRYQRNDQYQALWVVNTDFIANYGLSQDIMRNESDQGKTIGPFCIYQMKDCIVDSVISVVDNIQINWLQYQHHIAKSRPSGLSIEFTALQGINIGGQSGKNLTPKEALELYFDTGIIMWRRRDAHGNMVNWNPITELKNGINPAAAEHFMNCARGIEMLRGLIGLNEVTDASTPPSDLGKQIANMASGATEDALRSLHFAFDQINLGTHERTLLTLQGMARAGTLSADYTEAVGLPAIARLSFLSDISFHQLGTYLLREPTKEMQQRLFMYLQEGIRNQWLYEEEATEIEMEPNIYKRIKLMKYYRQKKNVAKQQEVQQAYQGELAKNVQSAQAAEQAKQATLQLEFDLKSRYEWEKARAAAWAAKVATSDEAFLVSMKAKMQANEKLSLQEQKRLESLQVADLEGQYALRAAEIKAESRPATAAK